MVVTFSDLHTEAGLKSLEAFLSGKSYISSDQITKDDVKVYAAILDKPSVDLYPTLSQWYESVASKLASSFPGKAAGVGISAQAPSTEATHVKETARAAAGDDDDDHLDLFGDQTEEEKKAAEERDQAKASTKKKETMDPSKRNTWKSKKFRPNVQPIELSRFSPQLSQTPQPNPSQLYQPNPSTPLYQPNPLAPHHPPYQGHEQFSSLPYLLTYQTDVSVSTPAVTPAIPPPVNIASYRDRVDNDVEDFGIPDEVEDDMQEVEEPVVGATTNRSRAKVVSWSDQQEVALAKAYVAISTDEDTGDGQKADGFWKRVLGHWRRQLGPNFSTARTRDQCRTKFKNLQLKCREFNAYYSSLKHQYPSGHSDEDIIKMALQEYSREHKGRGFAKFKVWEIVRVHEKSDHVASVEANYSSGSQKRTRLSIDGAYVSSHDSVSSNKVPDWNIDNDPPMPSRKGNEKSGSSSASRGKMVNEEDVQKYSESKRLEREERVALYRAQTKARLEREAKTVELMQLQLEVLNSDKENRDMVFFTQPHAHLVGPMLEMVLHRKRELAEKYGWPAP